MVGSVHGLLVYILKLGNPLLWSHTRVNILLLWKTLIPLYVVHIIVGFPHQIIAVLLWYCLFNTGCDDCAWRSVLWDVTPWSLVSVYETMWHHIPEGSSVHIYCNESLMSLSFTCFFFSHHIGFTVFNLQ